MTLDAYASSHPISQPVEHPKQIKEIFDSITYNKVWITPLYIFYKSITYILEHFRLSNTKLFPTLLSY